jgi:putative flavoprotein involved in K+ transport
MKKSASAAAPATWLVEEGAAFTELSRRPRRRVRGKAAGRESFDAIVVGAGQAGLSVGYHLSRRGLRFVILDAEARVGDTWRKRWDSLRLFTPARFDGLDGMPFPGSPDDFPTKDEMGDYLEAYVARFGLPVRTATRVERLSRENERYVVRAGGRELEAPQVVVAMANYQRPKVPGFAGDLRDDIVQIHSADYRNPSQMREGGVLLVGAGNSGSEIAMELARHHEVWMSGRDTGHIPFRIEGFAGRVLLVRLVLKGLFHRVLTVRSPIGRRVRPTVIARGGPLIRVKPRDLEAAGVVRVPRTVGVEDGRPRLEDGRVLDVANVVWCTGFHPGFSWIDLPILDERGEPRHRAGVVDGAPGLYFVGLHFLYALSSAMIHGVGRDAERIARTVAARTGALSPDLETVAVGRV